MAKKHSGERGRRRDGRPHQRSGIPEESRPTAPLRARRAGPGSRARTTSPQSDQLPPPGPHAQPDNQVDHRNQKPDAPPVALPDISCAEENRRRSGSVVRNSRVQIREVRQGQRGQQRGRPGGERRSQETGIERRDMRGHAGEAPPPAPTGPAATAMRRSVRITSARGI